MKAAAPCPYRPEDFPDALRRVRLLLPDFPLPEIIAATGVPGLQHTTFVQDALDATAGGYFPRRLGSRVEVRTVAALMDADPALGKRGEPPGRALDALYRLMAVGLPVAWAERRASAAPGSLDPAALKRSAPYVDRGLCDRLEALIEEAGEKIAVPDDQISEDQISGARAAAAAAGYHPPAAYDDDTGRLLPWAIRNDRRERRKAHWEARATAILEVARYWMLPYAWPAADIALKLFPNATAKGGLRQVERLRVVAGLAPRGGAPHVRDPRGAELKQALAWFDSFPKPLATEVCRAYGIQAGDPGADAIAAEIRDVIRAGRAQPGSPIPRPRAWGWWLDVTEDGAIEAFEVLVTDGVVQRGTDNRWEAAEGAAGPPAPLPWSGPPVQRPSAASMFGRRVSRPAVQPQPPVAAEIAAAVRASSSLPGSPIPDAEAWSRWLGVPAAETARALGRLAAQGFVQRGTGGDWEIAAEPEAKAS